MIQVAAIAIALIVVAGIHESADAHRCGDNACGRASRRVRPARAARRPGCRRDKDDRTGCGRRCGRRSRRRAGPARQRADRPAGDHRARRSAAVEQTEQGTKPGPALVASFEGLGNGFTGPQGDFRGNNPSDNSLAVGPEPHRADRELADGDLHEEGQEVRHDRQGALRAGDDQQRLQGLRRHLRDGATAATPSRATTSSRIAG